MFLCLSNNMASFILGLLEANSKRNQTDSEIMELADDIRRKLGESEIESEPDTKAKKRRVSSCTRNPFDYLPPAYSRE